MRNDTYISTLQDLQTWFERNQGQEKRPYFTLWRGYEAKPDRIILRNTELDDPKDAFELLEEIIVSHSTGGGSFRVFITDKPAHNVGMSTLVRLANPNPAAQYPATGIQGFASIEDEVKRQVDTRMKIFELEQQIRELLAEKTAAVTGFDQVRELLTEFPELRQLGFLLGKRLMGMEQHPTPATDTAVHGDTTTDDEGGFDYDTLEPALDKLRRATGADVETTISRLADWAAENPDTAKTMLQTL